MIEPGGEGRSLLNPLRGKVRLVRFHHMPCGSDHWSPDDLREELTSACSRVVADYGRRADCFLVHDSLYKRLPAAEGWVVPISNRSPASWDLSALAGQRKLETIIGYRYYGAAGPVLVFPDLADDPLGVLERYPMLGVWQGEWQ